MKKILLLGATGLLGKNIAAKYQGNAEVIEASFEHPDNPFDLSDVNSLKALFAKVGEVDAIICTAGIVKFMPLSDASDADWQFGINNKMMGQINTIRYGSQYVKAGGAIVLTTGILAQYPMPGSAMTSAVNAAVEAAIKATALELDSIRINAVSPGWIKETLEAMGMDATPGMPAADIAQYFVELVESSTSGDIVVAAK